MVSLWKLGLTVSEMSDGVSLAHSIGELCHGLPEIGQGLQVIGFGTGQARLCVKQLDHRANPGLESDLAPGLAFGGLPQSIFCQGNALPSLVK